MSGDGKGERKHWENQRDCGQRLVYSKVIKVMGVYIHILDNGKNMVMGVDCCLLESKKAKELAYGKSYFYIS